jgi:hypothetical protein
VPQKPILPVTGWMSFPGNNIPAMFNEGHIFHYIVESTPAVLPTFIPNPDKNNNEEFEEDEEEDFMEGSVEAFRRGKRFLKSKFVLNVKDRADDRYFYVKGEVRASMKLEIRNVTATISIESGAVLDASCTCKARVLGRCAHVSAVLLFVSQRVLEHGHQGMYFRSETESQMYLMGIPFKIFCLCACNFSNQLLLNKFFFFQCHQYTDYLTFFIFVSCD